MISFYLRSCTGSLPHFFFKWVGIFLLLVLLRVSLLAGESITTGTVLVQYRAQGYSLLAGHMAWTTALITVKTLELPLPLVMNVQQWTASCKYIRSAVVFWECVFRKHKKMYLYYCKKKSAQLKKCCWLSHPAFWGCGFSYIMAVNKQVCPWSTSGCS